MPPMAAAREAALATAAMGQFQASRGLSAYKCLGEFRPPILGIVQASPPETDWPAPIFSLDVVYCLARDGTKVSSTARRRRSGVSSPEKDEIVEFLLVEFRAERCLNLLP